MSRKRLLAALAALALVAGGSLAAIRSSSERQAAPAHGDRGGPAYLGIDEAQLRSDLGSGRSLAQVAAATPGRSAQGLIEAIVAGAQGRPRRPLANLRSHVSAEVQRKTGAARATLSSVAAGYLGLTLEQLRARMSAGETLAQIAGSIPGHSRAGLVAALVQQRRLALVRPVAARRARARSRSLRRSTAVAHAWSSSACHHRAVRRQRVGPHERPPQAVAGRRMPAGRRGRAR